jgi:hypothetical protein
MKPLAVAISIAICALSVYATDQGEQPKKNTTTTVLAAPVEQQAEDSPMVRAAKASGRLNKKPTNVITNETLLRTGGHFTTTAVNPPLPPPHPPTPAARPRQDSYKPKQAETQKKEQALRRAAADYQGESIEERIDDPAAQERQMQQMTSTQPKTMKPAKPPEE